MSFIDSDLLLNKLLKGVVDEENLNSSGVLFYELQANFGYDLLDVYEIINKCPSLLNNISCVLKNISQLSVAFQLKNVEMKNLFRKMPFLLLINTSVLRYKINLISTTYGCSAIDSIRLLSQVPELIEITKSYVISQNKFFSELFNEYGLKFRMVLRKEPKFLFVTKEEIISAKRVLMNNYTLTEQESQEVLLSNPELCFGENVLEHKFNFYYPKYFIKRDLKELLSSCPKFLRVSEKTFKRKIEEIRNIYGVEMKKACEMIRLEPNIVFFENISAKVSSLLKFNISNKYILSYPKICLKPEITLPLKYILARLLKLEDKFCAICEIDSNLFISRFLFMQKYNFNNYQDILDDENDFYTKYNITSRILKLSYTLDYSSLKNICEFYYKSDGHIKNWGNIIFPSFDKILKFFYGTVDNNEVCKSYGSLKETFMFTKREYKLYKILKSLQLSDSETFYVLNENISLEKYLSQDVKKIILELKKYGYSHEQIYKFLIQKQHLFGYTIKEFLMLIDEISENEKCRINEVIENYL